MRLIIDEVAYDLPFAVDAEGTGLVRARASMVVRKTNLRRGQARGAGQSQDK
jgi:hypothetical protein